MQRKTDGESLVSRIVCFVRGARTRTLIGQSGVYAKFREYPQLQDEPDSDEEQNRQIVHTVESNILVDSVVQHTPHCQIVQYLTGFYLLKPDDVLQNRKLVPKFQPVS